MSYFRVSNVRMCKMWKCANYQLANALIRTYHFSHFHISHIFKLALWARMDSNHRTPKRTDLQSVAVGHLATCPFMSQRRDSNPRQADYKSAALPAELLW